jgi:hypothetical protein
VVVPLRALFLALYLSLSVFLSRSSFSYMIIIFCYYFVFKDHPRSHGNAASPQPRQRGIHDAQERHVASRDCRTGRDFLFPFLVSTRGLRGRFKLQNFLGSKKLFISPFLFSFFFFFFYLGVNFLRATFEAFSSLRTNIILAGI